ncbi:conserved protein of unknown function [uncultured Candidatus Thioglobus sp.]|nr:conserved protein of unknown function [uncultured Candidatus Thioglobus sp.]
MNKKITLLLLLLSSNVFAVWPHSNISQAVFALDVVDRAPQNIVSEIDNNIKKIFFYTNLRNLKGQTITHRWFYNGKKMAEVIFHPRGNRWRVYSSKNLWHTWTGQWKVEVVNQNQKILLTKTFRYNKFL